MNETSITTTDEAPEEAEGNLPLERSLGHVAEKQALRGSAVADPAPQGIAQTLVARDRAQIEEERGAENLLRLGCIHP